MGSNHLPTMNFSSRNLELKFLSCVGGVVISKNDLEYKLGYHPFLVKVPCQNQS